MDVALVESSPEATKPSHFAPLIGDNFEVLLKESIPRFLNEFPEGKCDLSGFRSIFFRLLQCKPDPPLEIIWFYSAVSYLGTRVSENSVLGSVSAARDLFQLLSACSASCDGLKSIALLPPVIYKIHQSLTESSVENLSPKKAKKLVRETECLVEGILGYIGICSCKNESGDDVSGASLLYFTDLIKVWMVDGAGEELGLFFPLLSDDIRNGIGNEGCGIGYLAGIATVEAFLLRLCLKFRNGHSRQELQELKSWAIGAITGFRNILFFEMLLRMLQEPILPVVSILSSEDEALLREILFESVVLVEYSFLYPETALEQSDDWMKSVAVTWLITVHKAILFARSKGDQNKAISYINAFTRSRLPSGIIKWVRSQTGMKESNNPGLTTPQALLRWMVNLEDQGAAAAFGHDFTKVCMKLMFDESERDYEPKLFNGDLMKVDNDLFYIDNKGDEEHGKKASVDDREMQLIDSEFLAAAQMMRSTANDGRRKRKEGRNGGGKTQVKFLKYKIHDDSAKERVLSPAGDDGMSSGSEVENPLSEEEEDMEE